MPLYDRQCDDCGTRYDCLEKYRDATPCPECSSANTQRLLSAPNILVSELARGSSATGDSIDKWDRMRRKKMAIEERKIADHGSID